MGAVLDSVAPKLRYALRTLRRNPAFAAAALITLALGIGANAAVFSVVDGVLLRPLPYPDSEALVGILTRAPGAPNPGGGAGGIPDLPESASMLVTYGEANRSFESIGIWQAFATTVTGISEPEQVRTLAVSDGTLVTLAVQPLIGRWLSGEDFQAGGTEAVMLGYGYWQRRFGGDPSVVGRTITVDSRLREVVGVMPRNFRVVTTDPELITPILIDRSQLFLSPFSFQSLARLKPGVTIEQANADLGRLSRLWIESWGMPAGLIGAGGFESWRITSTARPLRDEVIGSVGRVLWVLMGTIGIVLVIACANVANLLLVRAEGRLQELAVRSALGAGWWRIVKDLLVESLWLGLVGGVLGLGVAYAAVRLLVSLGPATLPRLHEVSIDSRVFVFTVFVSLVCGFLFGLIPALKYAGRRLTGSLIGSRTASASRDRHWTRNSLVVAQVALALVLLVSAGLMIRTFQAMRSVEPGFRSEQLQTFRIAIPRSIAETQEGVARIQKGVLEAIAAIPGVRSAGFTSAMPMEGILPNPILTSRMPLRAESDADDVSQARPMRWSKYVSPGFFRTSGTRIIAGREYDWTDVERLRPVGIVSLNLAIELWGSPSAALGKRIRSTPSGPWREVIGVVENVRESGVSELPPPIVYWPSLMSSQFMEGQTEGPRSVAFAVRTPTAATEGLMNSIRSAVSSVDPNLPLALVRTMQEVYDESMARTSFTLVMLAIAGVLALVLGVVGIYGVISYVVAQRTREVGIRLALGAQGRELRRMFLRYGFVLAIVGVAIGLGVAMVLTRIMTTLLFEVSPLDPLTYVAVPILLVAAALLASYLPARRASNVDPAWALRSD